MAYVRKTHDEYSIEGCYDGAWWKECNAEDPADARRLLREYRENCPHTMFRIKKRRVPNAAKEG